MHFSRIYSLMQYTVQISVLCNPAIIIPIWYWLAMAVSTVALGYLKVAVHRVWSHFLREKSTVSHTLKTKWQETKSTRPVDLSRMCARPIVWECSHNLTISTSPSVRLSCDRLWLRALVRSRLCGHTINPMTSRVNLPILIAIQLLWISLSLRQRGTI